jgi:hypothetical protein
MKKLFGLGVAAGLFFCASGSYAWFHPERWEFRTGYGYQYKDTKSRPHNFQLLSFMASAAVPMGGQRGSGWFKGRLEWAPELWLGLFTHPYDRPLIGVIPLQFRYVFQPEWKLRPYLFAGAGVLYANINRKETEKDLNFNPQIGVGFYYALRETASLILEYRHVHVSNAGLHESNSGMNNHTFLTGVSLRK